MAGADFYNPQLYLPVKYSFKIFMVKKILLNIFGKCSKSMFTAWLAKIEVLFRENSIRYWLTDFQIFPSVVLFFAKFPRILGY